MTDYVLAVGTHDPHGFPAGTDADAIRQAVRHVASRHANDLRRNPQEVVTLMGPSGLLTHPSERIDAFVKRFTESNPVPDSTAVQPGDTDTPDCNGG